MRPSDRDLICTRTLILCLWDLEVIDEVTYEWVMFEIYDKVIV